MSQPLQLQLQLLDSFLQTLDPLPHNGTNDLDEAATKVDEAKKKRVLHGADFLFGSMLESALLTLDSSVITSIVSLQTARHLFVLKGKNNKYATKKQNEDTNSYFCLLPTQVEMRGENQGFHYCSCRSFFEKSKNSQAVSENSAQLQQQSLSICKHLLAVKLLPYVGTKHNVVETMTEEQFSEKVLDGLLGR